MTSIHTVDTKTEKIVSVPSSFLCEGDRFRITDMYILVGIPGFEPGLEDPESSVLTITLYPKKGSIPSQARIPKSS